MPDPNEKAIIRGVIHGCCAQWGLEVRAIDDPEADPHAHGVVDAIVTTSGPTIAVEHTRHQSLAGEIEQAHRTRRILGPLVERINADPIAAEGRFELAVDPRHLPRRPDLGVVEAWIRGEAPRLEVGSPYTAPRHQVNAEPPDLPFPATLDRWPDPDGGLPHFALRWPIDPDKLPDERAAAMSTTLAEKLPKLERARPDGGRTLLILDNRDIQLVNIDVATEATRAAVDALELAPPDAIVLAHLIGPQPIAEWIYDDGRWSRDLARNYFTFHLE